MAVISGILEVTLYLNDALINLMHVLDNIDEGEWIVTIKDFFDDVKDYECSRCGKGGSIIFGDENVYCDNCDTIFFPGTPKSTPKKGDLQMRFPFATDWEISSEDNTIVFCVKGLESARLVSRDVDESANQME